MREIAEQILLWLEPFNWVLLAYFIGINTFYLALIAMAAVYIYFQLRSKQVHRLSGLFNSKLYKPISLLVPAYNEEVSILSSVEALLQLQFPDFEVVVINDGSSDQTMERLIDYFQLEPVQMPIPLVIDHAPIRRVYHSKIYPELMVIDKENGGKADSLNAGINSCNKELICAIDADSILESDVLMKMLRAITEDENTIAVGGIVRVANGCTIEDNVIKNISTPHTFLGRIQAVEYLRAFLFGRMGWDYINSLIIISGAFGVFSKLAVQQVGGYQKHSVGEDMELVARLHRHYKEKGEKYSIRFLPEPVCWTEVPEDWITLGRQRNRWHRGLADTIFRHWKMIGNPRYGLLGVVAMPFFLIFELFGPVIEVVGFIYFFLLLIMGLFEAPFVLMFFAAAVLLGMVVSVAAVLCEELTFRRYPKVRDVLVLTLYSFMENIGYRQIHSWWRFKGLLDYLKGDTGWGKMTRKGVATMSGIMTRDRGDTKQSGNATQAESPDEAAAGAKTTGATHRTSTGRWTALKAALTQFGYWAVVYTVGFLLALLTYHVLRDVFF